MIEILTAILVIVTGIYAWETYRILKANERMVAVTREQSLALTRPYVTVSLYLEPGSPLFHLRIKNTGHTTAENLRLVLDPPFFQFGKRDPEHDISQLSAFREPIASFPPGAELQFHLAQSFVVFGEKACFVSELIGQNRV